eukprot:COSAG03_NODE_19616_length_333_cov_1.012821_1_plen_62_part_01
MAQFWARGFCVCEGVFAPAEVCACVCACVRACVCVCVVRVTVRLCDCATVRLGVCARAHAGD